MSRFLFSGNKAKFGTKLICEFVVVRVLCGILDELIVEKLSSNR